MIKARCGHTCAVRWTREASSFSTAWRKFHQRWPAWGELHATRYPPPRLNVPTARQARGAVVPVSIGFLRQFAATLAAEPGTRFDACRALLRSNDPAHVRGMPDPTVPICSRPSQFCNRPFPSSAETRHKPAADANHAGKGGGSGGKAEGKIAGRCLPSSWANAGAISLLTPTSNLAQY